MEEGSLTEGAKEKASCSSLVVGIKMEKMHDQSMRGDEKLTWEGSATMRAEGKISSGSNSMGQIERLTEEGSVTVTADEKAGSSSWVVEMTKLLVDTDPSVEMVRWKKTSIYRVPEWHKDLSNRKAYRPWLVSLGPFHHGEPDLLPMEEHKRRAVLHLVKRAGRHLGEFVAAIEEVVDKLRDAYQVLDDKYCGENRDRFVEMMVTDGCFLLEIMRMDELMMKDEARGGSTGGTGGAQAPPNPWRLLAGWRGKETSPSSQLVRVSTSLVGSGWRGKEVSPPSQPVLADYAPNDPVFSKHGLHYLFGAIRADMVVIENQLPLLALERLVAVQHGTPSALRAFDINNKVRCFLRRPYFQGMDNLGLHPLDIFHKSFYGGRRNHVESDEEDVIIPTAMELSEAGVHFKTSNTPWVHDVGFENGVLSMPAVRVDQGTEKEFLNLTVFEQLHGDAGADVTNYLFFMDHIIDSARDVALLRSKGIIKNLNSDKTVADMFNSLISGATCNTTAKLHEVKRNVNAYCAKRRNKWRAAFVRAYLSNPWVFISLAAAIILLVATLLQTIYTVVPFYTKS